MKAGSAEDRMLSVMEMYPDISCVFWRSLMVFIIIIMGRKI